MKKLWKKYKEIFFCDISDFSLEKLKLKQGYQEFLNILERNKKKETEMKKILIALIPLFLMFFVTNNANFHLKCVITLFIFASGSSIFNSKFEKFVENFILICKVIVKFENCAKSMIKFPNLNINISKLNVIKNEESIKLMLFNEINNLIIVFLINLNNLSIDNDNNIKNFELRSLKFNKESENELQNFYRLFVEIKSYYFDKICKGFIQIFREQIPFVTIIKYKSFNIYLNSLFNLKDKSELSFKGLNQLFDDTVIRDYDIKLFNSEDILNKKLFDIQLDTMNFLKKISNLRKIIDNDSIDKVSLIGESYQTICNVYNNFKAFQNDFNIPKNNYLSYINEKNPAIDDVSSYIEHGTRPHLLEHPMANKQPDEPKDDKNNFSFNHFEMIRMQKESKILQQDMLFELDDLFRSIPKKTYSLEELIE